MIDGPYSNFAEEGSQRTRCIQTLKTTYLLIISIEMGLWGSKKKCTGCEEWI
jgi:hypothetical protein